MYAQIVGNALLHYRNMRYDTNVLKYKNFLERSQWWPLYKIKELQNEKLRMLIRHAGKNVPYYKKLFKETAIDPEEFALDQLRLIPPVTKDIIRNDYKSFIAENADAIPNREVNTSGSTGKPFNYLQDKDADEMLLACTYRGMGYAGYNYGDKMIQIAGSALIPGITLTRRQKLSNSIQRIKSLPAIRLDSGKMNLFVKEINSYTPSIIRGYPSSLFILANHIEENGCNLKRYPKSIITTAEVLLPKYREKIENIFHCPVFDEYGCNDGGLISYECEEHRGLHYAAERVIVEIIENEDSLWPHGYGEVLLTDLSNFSMPFIRYKNGDIAKLSDSDCVCGRGLPVIEKVHGRSGDILKFNDRYLSTPALTLIFKDFNFDQYQLIKKADDLLHIRAVKGKAFDPAEERRLFDILRHHLGLGVNIEIGYIAGIETSAAGKWKFFIDMSKIERSESR